VTYNALLKALLKSQRLPKAEELFSSMERGEKGRPRPDGTAHVVMIDVFSASGRPDKAEALFAKMEREGPRPEVFACNALLQCWKDHRLYDKAEEFFASMERGESGKARPDAYSHSIMIAVLSARGAPERAEALLEKMEREGPRPDAAVLTAMLACFKEHRQLDKARALFASMEREENGRPRPTARAMKIMNAVLAPAGDRRR
jgi:myo-inositol-1(or 4)-monophosphatase